MIVVFIEPIKPCEFVEEKSIADLQAEAEALRAAIKAASAAFAEAGSDLERAAGEAYDRLREAFDVVAEVAEDVLDEVWTFIPSARIRHPRQRPPRIREGYSWLWVVPHLANRSAPERDKNGGGYIEILLR